MRRSAPIAALVLGAILAAGCGSSSSVTATGRVRDFAIELDDTSLPAGTVRFDIANEGPSTHEFVIRRTDLAQTALPMLPDGIVDEAGAGLEEVGEIAEFAAGTSASGEFELASGTYVVFCNIPGHYTAGMHASFTVE